MRLELSDRAETITKHNIIFLAHKFILVGRFFAG